MRWGGSTYRGHPCIQSIRHNCLLLFTSAFSWTPIPLQSSFWPAASMDPRSISAVIKQYVALYVTSWNSKCCCTRYWDADDTHIIIIALSTQQWTAPQKPRFLARPSVDGAWYISSARPTTPPESSRFVCELRRGIKSRGQVSLAWLTVSCPEWWREPGRDLDT